MIRTLFFTIALSMVCYAKDASFYIEKANKLKLYEKRYWSLLLHSKNGESEIDDPRFFLSKNGKFDPKAELNATIYALLNETRFDDNSTACLFPARKWWLEKELKIEEFPKVTCKEFDETVERLSPKSATIVFPAAHVNSPASMFGHTFLRINSQYKSKLLAYAVNYAAEADENRENAITFAVKGLFGGYYGKYSLLPYYEKLKEYRDREKRDIWEYDLNLNEEEVMQMVRHIWELNGIRSKYYFFTENCSYNILWLIEAARPSVRLREHFTYQVVPLETVHAIKKEGLLKASHYRPSKHTMLLKYEELIKNDYIHYVQDLQNNKTLHLQIVSSKDIPLVQKQLIFETAIELLEYGYSKNSMSKDEYLDKFYRLSKARASLKKGQKISIQKHEDPLYGHRAVSFYLGYLKRDKDFYGSVGIRPAYHSLEDNNFGFLRGTQIEFLDIELKFKEKKLNLEKLTLLSIVSLSQRSKLVKPFSWRTKFGWDQNSLKNGAKFISSVGAGVSWGDKNGFIYIMGDPFYYFDTTNSFGFGASLGLNIDRFKNLNTYIEATKRFYDFKTTQDILSITQGFKISKNINFKLSYRYIQKDIDKRIKSEKNLKALLNFYF